MEDSKLIEKLMNKIDKISGEVIELQVKMDHILNRVNTPCNWKETAKWVSIVLGAIAGSVGANSAL